MSEWTRNDMDNVAESIHAAMQAALVQYLDKDQQEARLQWIANLIVSEKPYLWVSVAGFNHIRDIVFEHDADRDFVYLLQGHFFTRWGEGQQKISGLIDVLSQALGLLGPGSVDSNNNRAGSNSHIPDVLQSRLVGEDDVRNLLTGNYWLVCLILLVKFVGVTNPENLPKVLGFLDGAAEVVQL